MRVASPKRGLAERTGLGSWFPYYAGFSLEFALEALRGLDLPPGAVVLDPMAGAGTVSVAARHTGAMFVGIDLNPVMATVAAGKDPALSYRQRTAMARTWLSTELSAAPKAPRPPAFSRKWFAPLVWKTLRACVEAARPPVALRPNNHLVSLIERPDSAPIAPSLVAVSALRRARGFAGVTVGSNPTWLRPSAPRRIQQKTLMASLLTGVSESAADLRSTFESEDARHLMSLVLCADSRSLPLHEASVDAVVTSPPYLTRLDYAVATAPELSLFKENASQRTQLRGKLMGTTSTHRRVGRESDLSLPRVARDTLSSIRAHPSKDSSGYYYQQHARYFLDGQAIAEQIYRVLKPGGHAVLVVQDSYYKDVLVSLAEFYSALFIELGARVSTVKSERVVRHLTQLNRAAAAYPKSDPEEHVLLVRKPRRRRERR